MAGTASNDHRMKAHFTYIWKINCIPSGCTFRSPDFTVQSMEMTKWNIILALSIGGGIMSCTIRRVDMDDGPETIELELELSFLDNNGSSLIKKSVTKDFRKNCCQTILPSSQLEAIFKRTKGEFGRKGLTVHCRIWRTRTKISKSELCFARTIVNEHLCACEWAVKGFGSLQQGDKRIRMLHSTTKGCPQLILTLSLLERNGQECVCIRVETPHLAESFQIRTEISLLDATGMVFDVIRDLTIIRRSTKIAELTVCEKSKLMSNAAVLLSDDVLLLRCEFLVTCIFPDSSNNRIEDYKLMEYLDPKTIQTEKNELNDIAACPFKEIVNEFKEDGTMSDVCLRAGTKSFPVHKLILSSRSTVFRAMFTKDMREKTSKCIDIPDLDADTMNRLLLYIYEDKVQDLTWETAANLFQAADKYELMALKEKCARFLKSNISESNVCEFLVLADMHQDENLQKSAQEFVLNNSEIIYSDVWKVFRDNHPKLALETAERIIYNMKHSRS